MSLPKHKEGWFNFALLSDPTKKIKIRTFTTKEEKNLALISEKNDEKLLKAAIISLANGCQEGIPHEDFEKKVSYIDMQAIILESRKWAKGEDINFKYMCKCGKDHKVAISLDSDIKFTPINIKDIIVENFKISMKIPTIHDTDIVDGLYDNDIDRSIAMAASAIKSIIDMDDNTVHDEFTIREAKEWLEGMSGANIKKYISEFKDGMPKVELIKSIKCIDGIIDPVTTEVFVTEVKTDNINPF